MPLIMNISEEDSEGMLTDTAVPMLRYDASGPRRDPDAQTTKSVRDPKAPLLVALIQTPSLLLCPPLSLYWMAKISAPTTMTRDREKRGFWGLCVCSWLSNGLRYHFTLSHLHIILHASLPSIYPPSPLSPLWLRLSPLNVFTRIDKKVQTYLSSSI